MKNTLLTVSKIIAIGDRNATIAIGDRNATIAIGDLFSNGDLKFDKDRDRDRNFRDRGHALQIGEENNNNIVVLTLMDIRSKEYP